MYGGSGDVYFIEVKVYSGGVRPSKARQMVAQDVVGVIAGGPISDAAKAILDDAGIWYRENVDPSDLASEPGEME